MRTCHTIFVCAALSACLAAATTGGVNVSSLAINPGPGKAAKLTLGGSDEGYLLQMEPGASGAFQIVHRDAAVFSVDSAGSVMVNGLLNSKGAFKTEGTVSFMSTPQWSIHQLENFAEGAKGWSNTSTTQCGNRMLLGGCEKFIGGETYKTYTGLPEHAQVRIKANYYMIDSWGGETAYMKVEDNYVWTDFFDQQQTKQGINVCCGDSPESAFGIPIDVIIPHTDPFLKLSFGSTLLGGGAGAFWGVDNIQVMIRKA